MLSSSREDGSALLQFFHSRLHIRHRLTEILERPSTSLKAPYPHSYTLLAVPLNAARSQNVHNQHAQPSLHALFSRRTLQCTYSFNPISSSLITDHSQKFYKDGCPNCEDLLHMKGSSDNINEFTSQIFEGLITLADPSTSWVAKWQRLSSYEPGVYAVKVVGRLADDMIQSLQEQGVRYVPRDGGGADEEIGA